MSGRHLGEVIIAIGDAAIRSALAARLGAGGEELIVADSPEGTRVSDALRARATLIVDAIDHSGDYVKALRASGWFGGLIVLVETIPAAFHAEKVAYLPRTAEPVSVAAVLQMWRARGNISANGDHPRGERNPEGF